MKNVAHYFLFGLFVLTGKVFAGGDDPRLKNTTWKLFYINKPFLDVSTENFSSLFIKDTTFSETSCNGMGGIVHYKNGNISFKPTVEHTLLYCLDGSSSVEDFWNNNYSNITNYKISNDTLYLFGKNDIKLTYHKGTFKAEKKAPTNGEEIYSVVQKMPEYPGGMQKMYEFIKANLKHPDEEVSGTVYVTFLVNKTGKISDVKILRSMPNCEECDKEAIRLVNSMPDWIPGEQNGKKVNVQFNLPIRFGY